MNGMLRGLMATAAMGLVASAIVDAQITIAPDQSMAGETENYLLRVCPEARWPPPPPSSMFRKVWSSKRLQRQMAGRMSSKATVVARIIGIVWRMEIPAGEVVEFTFVARNPRDKREVVWTLRQRFADGTVRDWTKGPPGVRSTSMTKLASRPGQ